MLNIYAPIAVFAFNRPDNLRRTLTALAANRLASESDLTIFCDGPRNEQEKYKTNAVRDVAYAASGFASVSVVHRKKNLGLKKSLISGITSIIKKYGKIIVIEDDIVTSQFFLQYMNEALSCYADNHKVASISGFCVAHEVKNPPETFFIRGGDCWGWGTWYDRWKLFNHDGAKLLAQIKESNLTQKFDLDGSCPSTEILQAAVDGKVDSWFMLWTASIFLLDMYTLYPSRSLVKNIGFSSGTHSNGANYSQQQLSDRPIFIERQAISENKTMVHAVRNWYKKNMKRGRQHHIIELVRATGRSILVAGFIPTLKKILAFSIKKLKEHISSLC